jgi:two-component system, NtrC family, response regulator AtoC
MNPSVLIIEDEPVLGKNMLQYLERFGWSVQWADSALGGLEILASFRPDAVVLDFNLPDIDGLQALARIQALQTGARVVMVTGHGSIELAVQAMKAGAADFVTKPVSLSQLRLQLEKATEAMGHERAHRELRTAGTPPAALGTLIGDSAPMGALKQKMQQLLAAEATLRDADPPAVLVLGETGTGKEVVARALHESGPRRDKPFVELNCAALPAQLLESELFGHERGAFTDARERKLGLVETADGGTLFLDEIGDMDLGLQAKLLKLLEEKTVRRLGSVREQRVSVRIVAATHRPLEALVREGRFRADLYYRLCVVQLHLPPLRERGADVLGLARHFLALHARRYGKAMPVLAADAQVLLQRHSWPGNVRELRNVLEQAVLLSHSPELPAASFALAPPRAGESGSDLLAGTTRPTPGTAGTEDPLTLSEVERSTLLRALQHNAWNVSRTARALGISRDTMRYRIDKHGLAPDTAPGALLDLPHAGRPAAIGCP